MEPDYDEIWMRRWSKHHDKAEAEGWNLFVCIGSLHGPLQIQASEEASLLDDDTDAWALVMCGTKKRHRVARKLMEKYNPREYELMKTAPP